LAVDAGALQRLLAPHRQRLRLVVICACLGGDHAPASLYAGSLAQAVHRLGIPAVVASRYPLSANASTRLTRVLYRALLARGASLEEALLQARAALHSPSGKATPEDPGDSFGSL
jgi:CHAT domain-containing protein